MFFYNLGYQWPILPLGKHGVCIGAQGIDSHSALTRRGRKDLPESSQRIFDPQMYLRDLGANCTPVVDRLVTYPWFNTAVTECPETQKTHEWIKQVSANAGWPCLVDDGRLDTIHQITRFCIDFQMQFGVKALILPAPMTRDPESDYTCETRWLDCGLNTIPPGSNLPVYATLAVSDRSLMHRKPDESDLLNTIVDQITARTELNGVYIVLEQVVPSDSPYLLDSGVAWALLRLCYDFGVRSGLEVIVNYTDIFGLACMAAGATGFCSSINTKGKRLCPNDFEPREGGRAYPKFYSPSLILNLSPRDIAGKIAARRLLRFLSSDTTEYSSSLIDTIEAEQDIDQVEAWQERPNNVIAARNHFILSVIKLTERLLASDDKISFVLSWLQNAERDTRYLAERLEAEPLGVDHRHISAWRTAFEKFLEQYHL